MAIDRERARQCLKAFDFRKLFIEELGWDRFSRTIVKEIEGLEYRFHGVAEKRGVAVLVADSIPEYAIRVKLDKLIAKDHFEHLIVFADQAHGRQKWQWVRKESGKPTAVRNYDYSVSGHAGELLLQKLDSLVFTLDEEEAGIHTGTVTGRLRTFDVEKVTKKFYERFKTEHSGFLGFIKGIPDKQMESWYASVMINRLMFLYFIQEKGFLNGDKDYLRNKLAESKDRKRDAYYTDFLCPLFFQGFARKKVERSTATNKLLGEIPYLNGGLFQKHQIEELHGKTIHIADAAFEKLFEFFKEYNWHLDERENRDDREINPDVLGYIFEKYINQKQMGAYYTKEDITEYISQNTIIPFLLDEARKGCAIAFAPEGSVWRLLRDHPDRYIHDAMKWGADETLPDEIEAGVHDVAQRAGWNRTAPEEFALPTEIWREAIDRHHRYRAVKAKLASGEVHEVNDLVTLNLNIRQFAQDAIQFSEGPELLRAIWKVIEKVSVLDPTCGSGAFLFAALNILKPLYEACLQRMRGFLEDLGAAGPHHPKKFEDFKNTLQESERHPKQDYFILKAIIVNNLFGVDIMEEAVEICKLRLFLKLVAQVESQDRIEPLPDIDFNIRSGNTLVGYARYGDVQEAVSSKLDFGDAMSRIEDKALTLDSAVEIFREQQTRLDGTVTPEDKAALRSRFSELENELNDHLSGEYGVKQVKVKQWKESHKPFHWFCDFHAIIAAEGFDVIIGNPPYVETSEVEREYKINGLELVSTGNLFSICAERFADLLREGGRMGIIVPISSISTPRMLPLMELLYKSFSPLNISNFAVRPGKLFVGVDMNLTILLGRKCKSGTRPQAFATRYNRWGEKARHSLFSLIEYSETRLFEASSSFPKIGREIEQEILARLQEYPSLSMVKSNLQGLDTVYYHSGGRYFRKCIREQLSNEYKELRLREGASAAVICFMSSSLYYWFWIAFSDCYHVTKGDIDAAPFPKSLVHDAELGSLANILLEDLWKHSEKRIRRRADGSSSVEVNFYVGQSKALLDKIDVLLAKHFQLTDTELDFIINYDYKYRMGADAELTS